MSHVLVMHTIMRIGYIFYCRQIPISRDTRYTYQLRMRWRHASRYVKFHRCRGPPKTYTCHK